MLVSCFRLHLRAAAPIDISVQWLIDRKWCLSHDRLRLADGFDMSAHLNTTPTPASLADRADPARWNRPRLTLRYFDEENDVFVIAEVYDESIRLASNSQRALRRLYEGVFLSSSRPRKTWEDAEFLEPPDAADEQLLRMRDAGLLSGLSAQYDPGCEKFPTPAYAPPDVAAGGFYELPSVAGVAGLLREDAAPAGAERALVLFREFQGLPRPYQLFVQCRWLPLDVNVEYLRQRSWRPAHDRLRFLNGCTKVFDPSATRMDCKLLVRHFDGARGVYSIAEVFREHQHAGPLVRVQSNSRADLRDFFGGLFLHFPPCFRTWADVEVLEGADYPERSDADFMRDVGMLSGMFDALVAEEARA